MVKTVTHVYTNSKPTTPIVLTLSTCLLTWIAPSSEPGFSVRSGARIQIQSNQLNLTQNDPIQKHTAEGAWDPTEEEEDLLYCHRGQLQNKLFIQKQSAGEGRRQINNVAKQLQAATMAIMHTT